MKNVNNNETQLSLFGSIEEIKNEEDISYRKKRIHEFPYEYASNICLEYFDRFTINNALEIYKSVEKIYDLESTITLITSCLSWHFDSMGFKKEGIVYIKVQESTGSLIANEYNERLKRYKEEHGIQ